MPTPAEKLSKATKRREARRYGPLECRLGELIEDHGLSIRKVGKQLKISNAFLCQVKHGGRIGVDHAIRIAQFFGLKVEDIWTIKKGE